MNNIETAIQFVKRQLKEQLGIDISFREGYGVDYFPHFLKGMDEIQYNKKIEMFLWLYNMVFRKNGLSSLAIIHYLLFYACLNSEKYDKANKHFQALEKELTKVKPDGEMADNLVNQISFIMLHEIYHVIFYDKPDIKDKIFLFERRRQIEIKEELEEMLKTISPKEIFAMPKMQPRINALFTSFYPKSMKNKLIDIIIEGLIKPEDYETKVLGDDQSLLEELACDRSAWLFLMERYKSVGTPKEKMIDLHCSLLVALTAMLVNENFHSHYFPNKHDRLQYDAKTVIIRQNSFKRLDQYIPIGYKEVSKEYLYVTEQVERIYQETAMSLIKYQDDIGEIYEEYYQIEQPKNEKRDELETKMNTIGLSMGLTL